MHLCRSARALRMYTAWRLPSQVARLWGRGGLLRILEWWLQRLYAFLMVPKVLTPPPPPPMVPFHYYSTTPRSPPSPPPLPTPLLPAPTPAHILIPRPVRSGQILPSHNSPRVLHMPGHLLPLRPFRARLALDVAARPPARQPHSARHASVSNFPHTSLVKLSQLR